MTEFIMDHYIVIMVIIAFILFAIIGFIVDTTKQKKVSASVEAQTEINESTQIEEVNVAEPELPIIESDPVLAQVPEIPEVEVKDNM